jgi:hypothetical protein
MPGVAGRRGVRGDPRSDTGTGTGDVPSAGPPENLVAVVQVKPAEARLTRERPVAWREGNGDAEDVDPVAPDDGVGVTERG